jgi:UDP-glucose 4-epimerase
MEGCEAVVHLAALTSLPKSWEDPSEEYLNNVVGTSNVLECAIKSGIKRIVYASSSSIYGMAENPYAASKAMNELLMEVRKDEIQSIGFRFFNVYGTGQNPDYGMVIPAFIKGIKKGEITIYGDGSKTRDFIHVDDICNMLAFAATCELRKEFPKSVVMDLGTGRSISIKELAYLLMAIMDKEAEIKYEAPRKECEHSLAKTEGAVAFFQPTLISLPQGLKRLLKEGL